MKKNANFIIMSAIISNPSFSSRKNSINFSDRDKELSRMMKRDNLSEEDALSRINAQMDIEEKRKRATYVLDNNGDLEQLNDKVGLLKIYNKKQSWK